MNLIRNYVAGLKDISAPAVRAVKPSAAHVSTVYADQQKVAEQRLAGTSMRYTVAKMEFEEAAKASMAATGRLLVARGAPDGVRHGIKLEKKAAQDRRERAAAAVEQCRREFGAALAAFMEIHP